MNDEEFAGIWTMLEPAMDRRRRIDGRVFEWLDAHDTSIAAEWLGLFKAAPFTAAGLAMASAVSIATAPPLVWLVTALI